jgi:hypothetical protein
MTALLGSLVEPRTWGRRTGTSARALRACRPKHEFFLALSLPGRGVVDDTSTVQEWGSNALMTMPEAGSSFSSMSVKETSPDDDAPLDVLVTLSAEAAVSAQGETNAVLLDYFVVLVEGSRSSSGGFLLYLWRVVDVLMEGFCCTYGGLLMY